MQSLGITVEFEFKIIQGSRLIMVLGSSIATTISSSNMPQATNLPTVCPYPLLRDMGTITSIPNKDLSRLPLPSPEGCGLLIIARQRIWGDPGSGRPRWCVTKTGHDICHGPFSLIFPALNKLTQLVSLK